jgi:succinate dehydrogenase / fumarate reductase iron-sulfur subunit
MKVTLRIQRYNPERDTEPYYQEFIVEAGDDKERILDLLHQVKWKYDGTLTFRRSCAHGVCGSDGIRINGRNRLACSTLLRDVNYKKPIVIEPLPSIPIVKDLIVDMSDFYKKYEAVKPYLVNNSARAAPLRVHHHGRTRITLGRQPC